MALVEFPKCKASVKSIFHSSLKFSSDYSDTLGTDLNGGIENRERYSEYFDDIPSNLGVVGDDDGSRVPPMRWRRWRRLLRARGATVFYVYGLWDDDLELRGEFVSRGARSSSSRSVRRECSYTRLRRWRLADTPSCPPPECAGWPGGVMTRTAGVLCLLDFGGDSVSGSAWGASSSRSRFLFRRCFAPPRREDVVRCESEEHPSSPGVVPVAGNELRRAEVLFIGIFGRTMSCSREEGLFSILP
jgi:hypothetical protein